MSTSSPLKILILEDHPDDAELMLDELRHAGFEVEFERVETEADYLARLDERLDVILADYHLPHFNARRALSRLQERGLDIPFIVVSGTIGEEVAVEMMRRGATDYLLKDRLIRLGQAIRTAMVARKLRSAHRQAEAALRASEIRFRSLIEKASDAVMLVNPDGAVIYDSPSTERVTGYAAGERASRNLQDRVHPEDRERMYEFFAQLIQTPGASKVAELRVRHKDGSWHWIEGVATNLIDEPSIAAVVINYHDISERKQAEEELARYRDHLEELVEQRTAELNRTKGRAEAILNNTTDGIVLADPDRGIDEANLTFDRLFAAEPDAYFGKPLLALVDPDDRDRLAALIQAVMADGVGRRAEFRALRTDNAVFEARIGIGYIRAGEVMGTGLVCSIDDITERIRAEQAVKQKAEEEREFHISLNALHDITLGLTPIDNLDDFYKRVVELGLERLGFDRLSLFLYDDEQAQAVGTYGTDTRGQITDEHGFRITPASAGMMTRALQSDERFSVDDDVPLYENLQPVATGWNAAAVLWNGTQSLGWIVADNAIQHKPASKPLLDILALYGLTIGALLARKQTNLALRESEANLATAQRIAHVGSWEVELIDPASTSSNPVRWSDEMYRLLGYRPGEIEVSQAAFFQTVRPDDRARLEATFRELIADGKERRMEARIMPQDGAERVIYAQLTRVDDEQFGRPLKIVGVTQDITELKQAELALAQALKAEKELGELKSRFVSMASHEFRTPMATVLSATELLLRYRSKMDEERIEQKLTTIVQQVKYLTTIINDVLDLSRLQSGRTEFKPIAMDFDGLCREVLEEFRNRTDVAQELVYTSAQSPLIVSLDNRLAREIINNLVSNAIKYSQPDKQVLVELELADEAVVLSVRDQGIGIPAADQKHLFEPFHRAGNVGPVAGTGLGLSITKEAVNLHGGSIVCQSEEGRGTTFVVTLPRVVEV